jgi:hypothetical protein
MSPIVLPLVLVEPGSVATPQLPLAVVEYVGYLLLLNSAAAAAACLICCSVVLQEWRADC